MNCTSFHATMLMTHRSQSTFAIYVWVLKYVRIWWGFSLCTFLQVSIWKYCWSKRGKKTNKTQKCSWRDESDGNQPARDQTLFLTKAKKTFFMGCDCHRSPGPPRLSSSLNTAPPFPPLRAQAPKLSKVGGCACGGRGGVQHGEACSWPFLGLIALHPDSSHSWKLGSSLFLNLLAFVTFNQFLNSM